MSSLAELRRDYHLQLCREILGRRSGERALTIADKHSPLSVAISQGIADRIGFELTVKPRVGQTAGKIFTTLTCSFLQKAFANLQGLRPGEWSWSTSQKKLGIAAYDQYAHLAELQAALKQHRTLRAALGGDYLITPDIVVSRASLSYPGELNAKDKTGSLMPPISGVVGSGLPFLHASISCKWTIRSDRAQNTRSEALNLIRNRKGRAPHIVFVTMEPLPSRLASIVLGTGDLDCSYHGALDELHESVSETGHSEQRTLLDDMIEGRRLKDIRYLPLDLAV